VSQLITFRCEHFCPGWLSLFAISLVFVTGLHKIKVCQVFLSGRGKNTLNAKERHMLRRFFMANIVFLCFVSGVDKLYTLVHYIVKTFKIVSLIPLSKCFLGC
jgi:hypothetical protein